MKAEEPPRIELVVFDMAGTTVRDDGDAVGRCLRDALAAAGLVVDRDAVNRVMGIPKPEAIDRLVTASPLRERLAGRVAEIHADFSARMRRYYASDPGVGEVAGARAVFARLRGACVRVALDTGFDRAIAQALLDRLGWREGDAIDAWIASDEVPRGRPHPDMIQALTRRLAVSDTARVAKVGDTPADLEEGTRAGCALVVGVWQGSHTRAALARHPHTHLVASVAEVPGLLGL